MNRQCRCGEKTADIKPAKYSPEDKYAKYRREIKRQQLIDNNLL
jgi:rRNA maturation protein Nop10